ncbi:MAG: hypothetical protein P9L99_15590 [Candidatus Lernaella stagnicola]|nr:hypothetical protein [Candidatus Lernaella stagnicola]
MRFCMWSVVLVCLLAAVASAGEREDEAYGRALGAYEANKNIAPNTAFFAATDELGGLTSDQRANVLERLAHHALKKEKDLYAAHLFAANASLAMIYPVELARKKDPPRAKELLRRRFKLAAWSIEMTFPWNRWANPMDYNASQMAANQAHVLNLWLAKEKLALAGWRAHASWMLGVAELVVDRPDRAVEAFASFARQVGDEPYATVAEGYLAFAMMLAGKPQGKERFARAIVKLESDPSEQAAKAGAELKRVKAYFDNKMKGND